MRGWRGRLRTGGDETRSQGNNDLWNCGVLVWGSWLAAVDVSLSLWNPPRTYFLGRQVSHHSTGLQRCCGYHSHVSVDDDGLAWKSSSVLGSVISTSSILGIQKPSSVRWLDMHIWQYQCSSCNSSVCPSTPGRPHLYWWNSLQRRSRTQRMSWSSVYFSVRKVD